MYVAFYLIAFLGGSFLPLQAGINATLAGQAVHPLVAACVNFIVGLLALAGALLVVQRGNVSGLVQASAVPAWAWLGGLLGAGFVMAGILTAPRLGAATFIALVIAGQMTAGLVLDHFGLVGFPVREIDLPRLAGAGLLIAGVLLIRFG